MISTMYSELNCERNYENISVKDYSKCVFYFYLRRLPKEVKQNSEQTLIQPGMIV